MDWITRVAALAVALAFSTATARADFDAAFQGTSPAQNLTMWAGGNFYQDMPTGLFQFQTGAGAAAEGFGPSFSGVCVEIFRGLADGAMVPHTVVSIASLPDFQAPPSGFADPVTKARYVTELWGRRWAEAQTPEGAAAFQLSVWEIMYDNLAALDVRTGYIRLDGDSLTSPTADLANLWLTGLTGDETAFTNNPLYAGMELVGLYQFDFQDQVTIRSGPDPQAVPAPAGVVLGLFGVAGLFGRRYFTRRAAA